MVNIRFMLPKNSYLMTINYSNSKSFSPHINLVSSIFGVADSDFSLINSKLNNYNLRILAAKIHRIWFSTIHFLKGILDN